MPLLRFKLPDQREEVHALHGARVTVGRRPENMLQILDRSVSGFHAEFVAVDGHYRLHDLESTNLCFVDGVPVSDFHLHAACTISFGMVECEFDPGAEMPAPLTGSSHLEKEIAFLESENAELQGKLNALERRLDILHSARLVTGRTETTPFAAANDILRAITSERDDLRHLTAGLRLELAQLREELAITAGERDAARRTSELNQAEKATLGREIRELRGLAPALVGAPKARAPESSFATAAYAHDPIGAGMVPPFPSPTPVPAKDLAETQKLNIPPPTLLQVPATLRPMQTALAQLTREPADTASLAELASLAGQLVERTAALPEHPISRLAGCMEAHLQDLAEGADAPSPSAICTLTQAADLIAHLLEPRNLGRVQMLSSTPDVNSESAELALNALAGGLKSQLGLA